MDTIRFQCRLALRAFAVTCAALVCVSSVRLNAATASLVGWSAQGVNETAGTDFSVFSLQPPGSTIRAQFMRGGLLVTNDSDVFVTYEAVTDASGSRNSTSIGNASCHICRWIWR